jgi:chromosome segregation ATPase
VRYDPVDYHDLRREDLIVKLDALQTRLENTEKSRRKCSQAYSALERRLQELQEENYRDALRIEALESELAEINFAFDIVVLKRINALNFRSNRYREKRIF